MDVTQSDRNAGISTSELIRVLVIEDNPADVALIDDALGKVPGVEFRITAVSRLHDAVQELRENEFEVALVDLGLPDSTGLETFERIAGQAESLPLVVLTSLKDEEVGFRTVQLGAQDFLVKSQIQESLLGRFIRFAIERHRLQATLEDIRRQDERIRELQSMERMSEGAGTSVSANIYSGGPLRSSAPDVFGAIVDRYAEAMDLALEERVHKAATTRSADLLELGVELGFMRATPRDAIDIHVTALKQRTQSAYWKKAQAYAEEGRLTLLELMGNLAGYYRNLTAGMKFRESAGVNDR